MEEKNIGTEKIGFDASVVPQVFDGKTNTYRLRDHGLKVGDKVAFENTQTGEIFGHAVITGVKHVKVKDINLKDASHYKTYGTTGELIKAFKRHYPGKNVTPETDAFVYTYDFTPANAGMSGQITYEDFRKVDMRVGKIVDVQEFREAIKPSYKLKIDFGKEIGIRNSSAQITDYRKEDLIGRKVIAVVNFPPKQIANFKSEVLTLGTLGGKKGWLLIQPEKEVELGARIE